VSKMAPDQVRKASIFLLAFKRYIHGFYNAFGTFGLKMKFQH